MKKIFWLSDSPFLNTGYSTISRNILNGLSDEYECHFLAKGYVGQTLPAGNVSLKDGFKFNFTVHGQGNAPYFQDQIQALLREHQVDYFGILLDTFMVRDWAGMMNFSPAKSIFYYPSDGGGGLPHTCEGVLRNFTQPVAMAEFGKKQVKDEYGIDSICIPHAVHKDIFYPLPTADKEKIKKDFVVQTVSGHKVKGFLANKFVVGWVGRFQSRKMPDRALRAFAEFCKDKPDVVLFLKTDPTDPAGYFDIIKFIKTLKIENRVVFSPVKYYQNYEYSQMNEVYNVMDCFILSTSGEGFGVPIIEAMACEVPVIVTDYTTTPELVMQNGQCGLAAKLLTEMMGSWTVNRGVMDEPDGAACLNKLYESPELRAKFGKAGREKVLKYYSWDVVIPQWKELLKRL